MRCRARGDSSGSDSCRIDTSVLSIEDLANRIVTVIKFVIATVAVSTQIDESEGGQFKGRMDKET